MEMDQFNMIKIEPINNYIIWRIKIDILLNMEGLFDQELTRNDLFHLNFKRFKKTKRLSVKERFEGTKEEKIWFKKRVIRG